MAPITDLGAISQKELDDFIENALRRSRKYEFQVSDVGPCDVGPCPPSITVYVLVLQLDGTYSTATELEYQLTEVKELLRKIWSGHSISLVHINHEAHIPSKPFHLVVLGDENRMMYGWSLLRKCQDAGAILVNL